MHKLPILAAPVTALALAAACTEPSAADETELSRADVEMIVREYILEHPEIIEEALIELSARQQAAETAAARQAIIDNADRLYNSDIAYSIGPDDAEVTLVEFFDYRCGFCKRVVDDIAALPAAHDGRVRVVFKELPILSAESRQAALAALAAGEQGKYFDMHLALMEATSSYSDAEINRIAEDAGVDVAKMRADMKSTEVQEKLSASLELARDLGVNGTPAFFIGEETVSGADLARVNRLIEEALAEG